MPTNPYILGIAGRRFLATSAPVFALDDYLAIISCGAYPTPGTDQDPARAYFAVSYGLLGVIL